ncbi:hypothetical protein [Methylococcus sp. EFPC2]|uniref:hypothetical protein n=1 Tax=Methylococcus sp. EFPC2 TaxID=2812648 RepID=UPI001966E570|nr:hypothetical protein [Methylococcus sp. EFPC2]QSA98407.1 hypothetical protein JWZ97_06255 [Methylococcus sp. EFPC2]
MGAPHRTVRRLRLRAPDEASARHTALRLEDALRTASLHDDNGRLVLVRRLALGRLPADATAQTLALALERAVERLGASCLYGGDEAAPAADAVWFRDPLDAHAALALRLLAGKTLDAWYWPLAVPAWDRQAGVQDNLRALAFGLAVREDAPAALPQWIATLVHGGHGERLCACLRDQDLPWLWQAVGMEPPAQAVPHRPAPAAEPTLRATGYTTATDPENRARIDREVGQTAAPETARRAFVRRLCESAGRPIRHEQPRLDRPNDPGPRPDRASGLRDGPFVLKPAQAPAPGLPPDLTRRMTAEARRQHAGSRRPPDRDEERDARPAEAAPGAMSARLDLWRRPGLATTAGGLMFLVAVLNRCAYSEWWQSQADWQAQEIARKVLTLLLDRLHVDADDPARQLAARRSGQRDTPKRFIAPAAWRDGLLRGRGALRRSIAPDAGSITDPSGHLILAAWSGPSPEAAAELLRNAQPSAAAEAEMPLADRVAAAWLTACRRWLRRYAGLSLADVVRRPAYLAHTPTHIDFWFDLGQADLRLRRAGLDLDPGWVPWLGRVVSFHYEHEVTGP